ncbi:MAG TPA: hypothetical protein VFH70_05375 [Acidimicrobiales bacterium]|nr:hypothetical protein [Acidimicrobiales bacterium]
MRAHPASGEWRGPMVRYDLVKEIVIAFAVVLLLTLGLAALFSSPDKKPATIKGWAQADPADFVATAVTELDGSSGTAGYGHPYNEGGAGQNLGPLNLQDWFPVTQPIDPATDFVLGPLAHAGSPLFAAQVQAFSAGTDSERAAWLKAYSDGLAKAKVTDGALVMPPGNYGPVAPMMASLLSLARSGALDTALLSTAQFYNTNYTNPLMFMGDGSYFNDLAQQEHLHGDQWGMMNETGNYPGQAWLWLYTLWYQVPPFSSSDNADLEIWLMMALLTGVLVLVPFIPGLRDIPRLVPVHKLIWRRPAGSAPAGPVRTT